MTHRKDRQFMTATRPVTARSAATLCLAAAAFTLSGCDWFTTTTSTDTQMKNVEILPGTASDEMITLDQASGDGTAIDTSVATGPAVPRPAGQGGDTADASGDAAGDPAPDAVSTGNEDTAGASDAETRNRDTVIRPPSRGAEREPETKN